MQIRTTAGHHLTPGRMVITQMVRDNNADKDAKKGSPHTLCIGMQTVTATVENSMQVAQKLKIELLHDPGITLLAIYPKALAAGS